MTILDNALGTGFCLVIFHEGYGGAWRALIASDMDSASLVHGELNGDDISGIEMQRYLSLAGALFPTATASTPSEAIEILNERLAGVRDWKQWRNRVRDAYEALRDAQHDAQQLTPSDDWWVGRACDEGRLVVID
jgi:hypothetical protein